MNDIKTMNLAANNIRILAASMVEKAKSGHPGGAMGGADFINVLFSEYLTYDPDEPTWTGRDRFFLDPGHMSPMLYSALCLQGKFTIDEIKQFRQWGSPTPGHPELDVTRGIENSSGPLGQGHAIAAGAAVAEKFLEARLGSTMMQHKIYAYISDGGIEEEILKNKKYFSETGERYQRSPTTHSSNWTFDAEGDIHFKNNHCPTCILKFIQRLAESYFAQKEKMENNGKQKQNKEDEH